MNAHVTSINVQAGTQPNPVLIEGNGPPIVYLHGLLGQEWDGFLTDLSKKHRIYAPANVGSAEADDLKLFDGFHDLVLYYDELFDRLGLKDFDLIGHSFGGMVAAEYAALFRHRVKRLVLIDPLGLWRNDIPVEDYLMIPPEKQARILIGDPENEAVKRKMTPPADVDMVQYTVQNMMSVASASHFIWPIPERGLAKRLYRITSKTLILWGAEDKFVPPAYAQDFAKAIPSAKVEMIAGAGHSPQVEQQSAVVEKITSFLS